MLIEPRLQEADWPFEGLAAFKENGKWGYLKGLDPAIAPRFDAANRFSNGRAVVWFEKKWRVIDVSGNLLATPAFDNIHWFEEGLCVVVRNDQHYGFIDRDGQIAIPFEFADARGFSDGVAPVMKGAAWGYIDQTGKFVYEPQFEFALPFREGLARIQSGGKFGFIDRRFQVVIPPRWKEARDFHEGRAAVMNRNGNWGFIDAAGRIAVKPKYNYVGPLSEGLATVTVHNDSGADSGYIDRDGNEVIPLQYRSANQFFRGLAFVSTMKQNHYIRHDGAVAWSGRWVEVKWDIHQFL